MMISIVIPVYNEEGYIGKTVHYLWRCNPDALIKEIIVSDGGSTDQTVKEAKKAGATVISSPVKGRAAQMNYGASFARGSVLYFLHADSFPPPDFAFRIISRIQNGYASGCFRLSFDDPHWFLKLIAWFTRFDTGFIRFGDQSLFIQREFFYRIGQFDENCWVMEDHKIIRRIKHQGKFAVIPACISTSARKFQENGRFRLMGIFFYIYFLYYAGAPQSKLLSKYRKLITNGKI